MARPEPTSTRAIFHCPRCDREFVKETSDSHVEILNDVIKHVANQHPDYDPEWFDTHSMNHSNEVMKVST
jgi:hypothetical protein